MPSRSRRKVEADPATLAILAELQAAEREYDNAELARLDVFAKIGYEPNCEARYKVRKSAADVLGIDNVFDTRVSDAVAGRLPPLCGKCPQEQFHAATEDDVLYGGAAGGGKSFAITAEGIKWCARYAGLRVLLIRRTFDELEESIFPALRKFEFAQALGGRWNSVKHELRFPNGSLFRFRYLETLDDAARRHGGEYQLLLVDELTLMQPGAVDILRYERIRAADGLPVIGVRATTNPGGASHGEVKTRYIEATDLGTKVVTDEHGLSVRFIQAKATDNPHLDKMQQRRLDAIPDPARRAAMRDGDWDQFSGQMFSNYREDRHTLHPVELPASWKRYAAVDWGFAKPWAVIWAAVDPDGRVWVYREIYETRVKETEQARRILAAEREAGEQIIARWADDQMWAIVGEAKPQAEVYTENGCHLTKASKGAGSRVQGWQRLHAYMAEKPACPHHRAMGWETCPGIHVFRTCKKLIWEWKNLPYATTGNTEDADPNAADHAMDATRYLLLNIGGGARFFDSPTPPPGEGPGEILEPMGQWAVRPGGGAPVRVDEPDPDRKPQGATQTWDDMLAAMKG